MWYYVFQNDWNMIARIFYLWVSVFTWREIQGLENAGNRETLTNCARHSKNPKHASSIHVDHPSSCCFYARHLVRSVRLRSLKQKLKWSKIPWHCRRHTFTSEKKAYGPDEGSEKEEIKTTESPTPEEGTACSHPKPKECPKLDPK